MSNENIYACPDCHADCFGTEENTEYDERNIIQFYICRCGCRFTILFAFTSKEKEEK